MSLRGSRPEPRRKGLLVGSDLRVWLDSIGKKSMCTAVERKKDTKNGGVGK